MRRRLRLYHLHSFYAHIAGADIDRYVALSVDGFRFQRVTDNATGSLNGLNHCPVFFNPNHSIGDIAALSTWSAWRAGATLLDSSGREKIPHYAARYINSGPVIGQEAPQLHGRVTELRTRMYQTSG